MWMQDVLRKEHHEKSQSHYQHLSALQGRYKMLEKYIDAAYDDKLSGDISELKWREKNSVWLMEQAKIRNEIESLGESKQEYIEKGVLLIELAQRTESIYKTATTDVKRKMVRLLSSNHSLRNGDIEFYWEKPFDLLASAHPQEKWWADYVRWRTP
jgi:hypothetical protein